MKVKNTVFLKALVFLTIFISLYIYYWEYSVISNLSTVLEVLHLKKAQYETQISCKIPKMEVFDEAILPYIFEAVKCPTKKKLVVSNETHLIIKNSAFPQYYVKKDVMCYYHGFRRVPPKKDEYDYQVEFIGNRTFFNTTVRVKEEFVRVTCEHHKTEIYVDYFTFVPMKEVPNTKASTEYNPERLNILVLGMDAVSRLNLQRQMPRTYRYVKENLSTVEFYSYNKIGDNTYPNLIVVLSGRNWTEIVEECRKDQLDRFDNCSSIWKILHAAGYATGFGEETTFNGLYTYKKGGWYDVPIMHYWETFAIMIHDDFSKLNNQFVMAGCEGYRKQLPYLFDFTLKFIKTYNKKKNYFLFSWETYSTHDDFNYNPQLDITFEDFMKILVEGNYLNNTALIFMSDHGLRYGPHLDTYQGRLEERLPFLYIVLPTWFQKKHPKIISNLYNNQWKLATHFDLHETFKSIIHQDYNNPPPKKSRGISLFYEIPSGRTCEDAGILPHFCLCKPSRPISKTSPAVNTIVSFLVAHLNSLLSIYKSCALLSLSSVQDARILEESTIKYIHTLIARYTIVFVTEPGGGVFEATVDCHNCTNVDDLTMAGPVTRHNKYGHQSDCIKDDARLKLYCYCQ